MTQPFINLLYIEDDRDEVELAKLALKAVCPDIDFRFQVIEDGERALRFLESNPASLSTNKPDVILLDLNLPKINGNELIEAIKSKKPWKDVPVIVLSGGVSAAEMGQLTKLDVEKVLAKGQDLEGYKNVFGDICQFLKDKTNRI